MKNARCSGRPSTSSLLLSSMGEQILLSRLDTAAGWCHCHRLTFLQCCLAATIPEVLYPCLCVPWPLPVVELISLDSMASLYPSLSHICGLLPQPPHPPGSHPSLGLFPRSPPPNQLFSPAPPPLCHGALLLPSSLLHRLSSISFWHWHFLVPTINCSSCRSWWHKVLFHCCSSPHPLQPGLHVS